MELKFHVINFVVVIQLCDMNGPLKLVDYPHVQAVLKISNSAFFLLWILNDSHPNILFPYTVFTSWSLEW